MAKLSSSFFQREDVILISKELLGMYVYSNVEGQLCGGIIVETEAYCGPEDRGSHAYRGIRTPRNEIMYGPGGYVYMYICYGIHDMLNIVTGKEGMSHAILIRAIQPETGLETMRQRRNLYDDNSRLCRGPGSSAKALGLSKRFNGTDLQKDQIWIEDKGLRYPPEEIIASARIGMNFDGPYKSIPWRFYIKGNPNVSRPHI